MRIQHISRCIFEALKFNSHQIFQMLQLICNNPIKGCQRMHDFVDKRQFFCCTFNEIYRVETIRIKQKHDNHFNEWLCGRRHDDLSIAYNFKAFKNMLCTERLFPDFVTLCKFNICLYLFPHFLTNLIHKDAYSVRYTITMKWTKKKKKWLCWIETWKLIVFDIYFRS